jgi:beta-lactamase regulating signal transducer with metallopeptidase domain
MNTTDIFERLAESLLHFVWQGSLLAVIALVADRGLRGCSAQLRYAVHVTALLLMLACVPVTYALLERQPSGEVRVATLSAENKLAGPPAIVTSSRGLPAEQIPIAADENPKVAEASPLQSPPMEPTWDRLRTIAHSAAPYTACAYLLGVALMFGRLTLALMGGHRLCLEARPISEPDLLSMVARQARKIGLRAVPVVAWCGRTSVPLVAGLIKPMILLPVALASSLTPDQIEALLAHELAHLRRFDLLVNLLQRVAEALLFFHPAVWYVSRRISSERENCCDDSVLRAGWGRVEYADALVRMAEVCVPLRGINGMNAAAILAAVGNNPSQFKRRILRLLGEQESLRLGVSRGVAVAILGGVLAVLLAIPALFSAPLLVAQNEKSPTADTPTKNDREPEILPGYYRLSFHETPWKNVLAWYGRVMGQRIEIKTVPAGNFSYESSRPLHQVEIAQLINSELLRENYCLVEEGGGLSVQPAEVIARQYAEELRKDFMHGFALRKGPDKFESYFEIVDCRVVGRTKPPAPSGPAIAYVLKARRDFSAQDATTFFGSCFPAINIPSVKTGQPVVADGFAALHNGKWLGTKAPALQKGEHIEVWQNRGEEWNARPPQDYRLVIEGSVVGPDGKPVAARVHHLLLEAEGLLPPWGFGGELVVDNAGEFQVSLQHGTQFVRLAYFHVFAPGYAPQRIGPIVVDYEKPAVPLKIELKPGFSGRLRLVLPDGKALDEGEVEVTMQDEFWTVHMPMAKLPIDGKPITVANCPAGPLRLKVRVPGFAEQEVHEVRLTADQVTEVKVPLTPQEGFFFRGQEALKRIDIVKPAWSESQNGVEFGIARLGDKREFHSGERVPLELFIRNTGDKAVKVEFAADFLWNVPEVRNERGEAVEVERVLALGSVALYRETLKPGEAFGFRHLGLGLGPNPAPGRENWIPNWAEPKAGKYKLRHTHTIDVEPVDESKPQRGAIFTTGTIEFEVAAPAAAKAPDAADPFAALPAPAGKAPEADPFAGPVPKDKPPENGVLRRFSSADGHLESEEEFKNGKLHGTSRRFDKLGLLISEHDYEAGLLVVARQFKKGKLVLEEHYQRGKRNGPAWTKHGKYEFKGHYLNGEQDGKWTVEGPGDWKFVRRFKDGKPDGVWEWRKGEDKLFSQVTFKDGKLVGEKNSQRPAFEKVTLAAKDGKDLVAARTFKTLNARGAFEYAETPLWEALEDLHERFNCPMYFDPQAPGIEGINEMPVWMNEKQMPLVDCLSLLAAEHGLTFDYRFHALWLTTPEAILAHKDTTGISDLKLAPASSFAKAFSETPKFDFFATALQNLPEMLKTQHGLEVDVSKVSEGRWHPRPTADWSLEKKLTLREALGITLTLFNCHCREEGGKLIIEPLKEQPK